MKRRVRWGRIAATSALGIGCLVITGAMFAQPLTRWYLAGARTTMSAPKPTATRVVPTATPTAGLPSGNDWRQYRYDVAGTGVNPEGLIDSTTVAQLQSTWTFKGKFPFGSTAAVVQGVVYIPNGKTLYALDFKTGAKLWTFEGLGTYQYMTTSSVAVDSQAHIAYYGTPDARVYAVSTLDGSLVWQKQIADPAQGAYIWSSPLLVHGAIYIGLSSNNDTPCVRGAVFALDAATGATRWVHYTAPSGVLGGGVWSSVIASSQLHAIIATTGNPCGPSYVSTYQQDAIVAMDWDTGATLWSFTALTSDICDCDFGGGAVNYTLGGQQYFVAGNKYGTVYALRFTGSGVTLAWSRRIALTSGEGVGFFGGTIQPPTYLNGTVYIAGGTTVDNTCPGAVWALAADTGAVRWRACTPHRPIAAGAASGDVVFMGYQGALVGYHAQTGQVVWKTAVSGDVWSGVAISRASLLVASANGTLTRYKLAGAGT
jgi:outer membrane protein assembly factor BamB